MPHSTSCASDSARFWSTLCAVEIYFRTWGLLT